MILDGNPLAANMTVKARRVHDVAHFGTAPGAFAFEFADSNHWTQKRCEHTGNNHRDSEKCAEAGQAKHRADDDADGRDDQAEQQSAKGALYGRFFNFGWTFMVLGLRWDYGSAKWAEAPGR